MIFDEGALKEENIISHQILGAAIEVHRCLGGPGLLDSVYEAALFYELTSLGLHVQQQLMVPILYKGVEIKAPLILDLLVENKVVVEAKAVDKENPIFQRQLLTYLRMKNLKLGLIINFGKEYVKDGICRVVNGL